MIMPESNFINIKDISFNKNSRFKEFSMKPNKVLSPFFEEEISNYKNHNQKRPMS